MKLKGKLYILISMKMRAKYIIPLILVLTVSVAGLITINTIHEETLIDFRDLMNRTLEMYKKAFAVLKQRHQETVKVYVGSGEFVENSVRLIEMSRSGIEFKHSEAHKYIMRMLVELLDEKQGAKGFYLISSDFTILAAHNVEFSGQVVPVKVRDEPLIKKAFRGEAGFAALHEIDGEEKEKSTIYSELRFHQLVPVKRGGEVIAILVVNAELSGIITEFINAGWFGKTAEIYILDKNGVMITESRFTYELVNTGLLGPEMKSAFNLKVTNPGVNVLKNLVKMSPGSQKDKPLTEMAADIVKGNSGFNLKGYRNYLGTEVIGVWQWSEELKAGMAFEIRKEEAYADYYAIRDVVLLLFAFMFIVFLILIYLFYTSQKRSADELQRAYDDLAIVINERTRELRDAKSDLEDVNRELAEMATIDKLTGLDNRRSLTMKLEKSGGGASEMERRSL